MNTPAVLFFDTETTGLPADYKAPLTDSANWPRMVQLAWIVTDIKGETIDEQSAIIRPDGFVIPDDVAKIHGISQSWAELKGLPLRNVMEDFDAALCCVPLAVAHNVKFDQAIVGAERVRLGMPWNFLTGFKCTMASGTAFTKLPKNKWPTLQELHLCLFGKEFDGAHNALNDVRACAKAYWELMRRKNADPRAKVAA